MPPYTTHFEAQIDLGNSAAAALVGRLDERWISFGLEVARAQHGSIVISLTPHEARVIAAAFSAVVMAHEAGIAPANATVPVEGGITFELIARTAAYELAVSAPAPQHYVSVAVIVPGDGVALRQLIAALAGMATDLDLAELAAIEAATGMIGAAAETVN